MMDRKSIIDHRSSVIRFSSWHMKATINNCVLEIVQGDITQQQVDALVNAANSQLAGGGGVDGAIHRHGGPSIMEETKRRYPSGCPTGSAVITSAGSLTATYVIHAVGPFWNGGDQGEPELLARVHRRCLELAAGHECKSIAFPAISTGAYRYPIENAAQVALATTIEFLEKHGRPELVRFVVFSNSALVAFESAMKTLRPS
jgi:O-acetyl-ADP-ribose deacetylase (regulator of RNase III)